MSTKVHSKRVWVQFPQKDFCLYKRIRINKQKESIMNNKTTITIIVFTIGDNYDFRTEYQALPAGAIVVAIVAATLVNNELSTDYKYLWTNEIDPIGSNFELVVIKTKELDK